MADHRLAEQAARVLRAARSVPEANADADAAGTIASLQEAIVRTAYRQRRRRVALTIGAVTAACAASAVVALRLTGPAPIVRATRVEAPGPAVRPAPAHPAAPLIVTNRGTAWLIGVAGVRPALSDLPFVAGDVLRTDATPLDLRSADGTYLSLGAHSALTLARADRVRWLRLDLGALDLEVAKLSAGQRFVVQTPDREIEVKGTRFHVRLVPRDPCGSGTITRVTVDEGVVTVRDRDGAVETVAAGGRWPAGCAAEAVGVKKGVRPTSASKARPAPPTPVEAPHESTLSAENDLFSAAVRAERAGDRAGAIRMLDQFIAGYPASPLREAAAAERLKLAVPPSPGGAP